MKAALLALLLLATPALAHDVGYGTGFGYQPRASYRSYQLPRRTVTTITPTRDGGRRIETRRYYGDAKGGRIPIGRARGSWR